MNNFLFPHETPRKIQKAFMAQLFTILENKQNYLVHAPTGIGKTASALAPSLSYALKNKKIVFFLTTRHTQHLIAIETLKKIKEKNNVPFNSVDLVGKQWMCNQSGVKQLTSSEFAEYCKELKKKQNCVHFSNLKRKNNVSVIAKEAMKRLKKQGPCHVEKLNEICSELNVCPYETACLFGKDANVIIADYYHMMHPAIRKNLLAKMDKDLNDCIIIFDEGHNLPQRARKLLTSKLPSHIIDLAVKEAQQFGNQEIANQIIMINDVLTDFVKQKIKIHEEESLINKKEFIEKINDICEFDEFIGYLDNLADSVLEVKKRSFVSHIVSFLESWKGPDEGFVRILSRGFNKFGKVTNSISYRCLDPSFIFEPLINDCHSIVIMSGTLTPTSMYKNVLGIKNAVVSEFNNPFPPENKKNLIVPETSTKYNSRCKEMYEMIAKKCNDIISGVPGNCAIFFPSYYLRDEIAHTLTKISEKTIFNEQKGMTKKERTKMLENFKKYKNSGAVLLGVSSGGFGEGIDLLGDYLKCVVIAGLPLSKPNLKTKKLITYYDKKFKKGWDYGYIYPAIIKTMQNAGRCIRSKDDKGIVVFLDERYIWNNYLKCFPNDWNMKISKNINKEVKDFFENIQ